jgi:hypothetical protein
MRTLVPILVAGLLVAAVIMAQVPAPPQPAAAAGAWRTFEGTSSASGQRQTIPTESGRPAVTVQLSGAVSLTVADGLSHGFRDEVIGFDDGTGLTVLRSVWTDENGDRIFSQLKGETVASGRRIAGTILGGTGRYAGITGDYSFEWQYVLEAEAGTISGRAIGLKGRFRHGGAGR